VLGAATFHGLDISRTEQLAFNADSTALAVGDEEDIQLVRARNMATKGQDPTAATAAAAALRSKQRAGAVSGNSASSVTSTGYGASPLSQKKHGHSSTSKSSSSSSSVVCRWILPTAVLAVLVLLGYWYTTVTRGASIAHSGWSGSAVSTVDRLLRPLLQLFLYKDGSGSK
jgi:cobalamin biosynthesis Mg chelatase CobN